MPRALLRLLWVSLAAAAVAAFLPHAAALTGTVGPYSIIDYVEPGGPAVFMEPFTAAAAPLTLDGTNTGPVQAPTHVSDQEAVTLPFPFEFFGVDYTTVFVNNNGYLTFQAGPGTPAQMANPQPMPGVVAPDNLIAGCWQDYKASDADSGSVKHETFGTAPNRVFIVQFEEVSHDRVGPNTAPTATFQIKLFENGTIEVHVPPAPSGCHKNTNSGNAWISPPINIRNCTGIENASASPGHTYICGDQAIQGVAVRYEIRNSPPNAVADTPSMNEDAPALTVDVMANDSDPDGHSFVLDAFDATSAAGGTVTRDDNALVGNPVDDRLVYTPPLDFCGSDTFDYTIEDSRDTNDTATVTVSVACVNDAPDFTPGAATSVLEDAGATTVSGWATGRTPGGGSLEATQTVTVEVVSVSDPALFSAGPTVLSDGSLSFTPAADRAGTATVTLRARDTGGTLNGGVDVGPSRTTTIEVRAVNDAPSFTAGGAVSVVEDAGAVLQPWATAVTAGPGEASQTVAFDVAYTNPGLFAVAPTLDASGQLTFTPAADTHGLSTVTVLLEDDGGTADGGSDQSGPVTFQVEVRPVNDAPAITLGPDLSFPEDAGAQSVPGWLVARSPGGGPDEAGQAVAVELVSATPAGLFAVAPAVDAAGTLTFTPVADAGGTIVVTMRAFDGGGTVDGGQERGPAQTFEIVIASRNDPPVFTPGPALVEVLEDSGAASLTWATGVGPGGGLDEAGQGVAFEVGVSDPGLFAVVPALSPTGVLTFTPMPQANGVATVTVRLRDDGGVADGGTDTSAWVSFQVRVRAVNDAPTIVLGEDKIVLGDGLLKRFEGWATGIGRGGGADEASQTLTVDLLPDAPTLFAVAPALDLDTGDLTFVPADGAMGSASVTLTLRDDGGAADGGSDTRILTFLLGIGQDLQPPRADFDVRVRGTEVEFLDRSFNPTSQPMERLWTFGDGASSTATDVVHDYAAPGVYPVRLWVRSASGLEHAFVRSIAVGATGGAGAAGGSGATLPDDAGDPTASPSAAPVASQVDRPPLVQVARGTTATPGATVELDASRSSDPERLPLVFRWRQTEGPAVVLLDADRAVASFRAPDQPATLAFVVAVSDGQHTVEGEAVRIRMEGAPPAAAPPLVMERLDDGHALSFAGTEPVEWRIGDQTLRGAEIARITLPPGTHLVQVRDAEGREAAGLLEVPAAATDGGEDGGPATLDEAPTPVSSARIPAAGWGVLAALAVAVLAAALLLLVARRR